MMSHGRSLSEIKGGLLEVVRAIETLERHYPNCVIELSPEKPAEIEETTGTTPDPFDAHHDADDDVEMVLLGSADSHGDAPLRGGNRILVANAARDGWKSINDLMKATGLGKRQIYGVVLARDGRFKFDRMETPVGTKMYKLAAE